jgi:hypothetical protein
VNIAIIDINNLKSTNNDINIIEISCLYFNLYNMNLKSTISTCFKLNSFCTFNKRILKNINKILKMVDLIILYDKELILNNINYFPSIKKTLDNKPVLCSKHDILYPHFNFKYKTLNHICLALDIPILYINNSFNVEILSIEQPNSLTNCMLLYKIFYKLIWPGK